MNGVHRPQPTRTARFAIAALLTTSVMAGGAAFLTHSAGAADAPSITGSPVAPSQAGFSDLVAKVKPAVVNIATTEAIKQAGTRRLQKMPEGAPFGELFRQFGQPQQPEARHAQGSGFIVDPEGYVVTNNHVVDGASKVTVTLTDGVTYTATVKGRDPKTDLAVLKIDAPINPGNSGGPLFDQSGRVVGIDTAIYSPTGGSVGIGFAIPSNLASKVVAQLRDHGSVARGWLGVQMQPVSPELAKAMGRDTNDGALVNEVQPDSPAARSELHQGDIIATVNGKAVKGPRDLAMTVVEMSKGAKATLSVWRDGHEHKVDVTVAAQPLERLAAAEAPSDSPVGLTLAPLSEETRSALGIDGKVQGVVVARVTVGSPAAESGIRQGDVIVKVGNDSVASPPEAATRLKAAQNDKKAAVALLVMREGTTYYLALKFA